jgi:hypothetical protein
MVERGHVQPPGEAVGALAVTAAGDQDPADLGGGEGVGAAAGSGAAVDQASSALGSVATKPLVGGGPGQPQALSGLGRWPAEFGDALDQ